MKRNPHTLHQALSKLRSKSEPDNLVGMSRFGIQTEMALGVSMPNNRSVGGEITKDHGLALELWGSGIHEARILASIVDNSKWVTSEQMDDWAADFNSWDLCDQVCGNLFDRTAFTDEKIQAWSMHQEEFVKRAAFALIAWRSVHDKKQSDDTFLTYLPIIDRESGDSRNFVKKAVNWALRQIGKRSNRLHEPALALARKLAHSQDLTRRWIGKNAVAELDSAMVRARLQI